eukprot:Colp12_sorted_trinity150504_noHs@1998
MADTDPKVEDVDAMEEDAVGQLKATVTKRKGRGFSSARGDSMDTERGDTDRSDRFSVDTDVVERSRDDKGTRAAKSVEGWIVIATNIHEEATEDHINDKFAEFGTIKNLHLNLDRRSGYVKGYALVEYDEYAEATAAIEKLNGATILEQPIAVDYAFLKGPIPKR